MLKRVNLNNDFETSFLKVVDEYIDFEKLVNQKIKEVSGRICSDCKKVCCDEKFCEVIYKSEFLSFVVMRNFENQGKFLDIVQHTMFLGTEGCILDAGRYPECIRFICLNIVQNAFKDPYEKIYYYGISNLLPGINNAFSGRYQLYDLELSKIATQKGIERLKKRIDDAKKIFDELSEFKAIINHSGVNNDNTDIRDYILKLWGIFPYAAKSMYVMRQPTFSLESFYE